MKIFFHPYELTSARAFNRKQNSGRKGALLRIEEAGEPAAFADCCPLTEFHEEPLTEQLRGLRSGVKSRRLERAFDLAMWERESRKRGEALLARADRLRSHALVTQPEAFFEKDVMALMSLGFDTLKLKMGRSLQAETECLLRLMELAADGLRIRLDFNGVFDPVGFRLWWESLPVDVQAMVEFVEDPCPFEPDQWRELRRLANLRLALDLTADPLAADPSAFDVVVIKPALQNPLAIWDRLREEKTHFVFTHAMDHPLGQLYAQAEAIRALEIFGPRMLTGGWALGDLFQPTVLGSRILTGPRGRAQVEPGLGVAAELEKVPWTPLSA